jgi:HEAT repeat protein
MRIRILFVLAVVALVVGASGASASQSDQPQKLPTRGLFDKALAAKGDEYIKLRGELIERKNALSFLKTKMSDKDWKTAILAEAMLGCKTNPETYRHFEELLIVPLKRARGLHRQPMPHIGFRPFSDIWRIATGGRSNRLMPESRKPPSLRRRSRLEPALHQEDAIPFLVELALKDSIREPPSLASSVPLADNEKMYTVSSVAALLQVTERTIKCWSITRLLPASGENDQIAHKYVMEFFRFYQDERPLGDPDSRKDEISGRDGLAELEDEEARELEAVRRIRDKRGEATNRPVISAKTASDPGALARCYAVIRLGCFEHPAIVPTLVESLQTDGCDNVRAHAARQLYAPEAVVSLRKALSDKAPRVRRAAAKTLGGLADTGAVRTLIHMLRDTDYDVRAVAAAALGDIGDSNAAEPLLEAMGDKEGAVGRAAGIALAKIDFDVLKDALGQENPAIRRSAWQTMTRLKIKPSLKHLVEDNQPDVNSLVAALRDQDGLIRPRAARMLAETDMKSLVEALKDKSEIARQQAASTLGDKKYAPALDSLIAALRDESSHVRRTVTLLSVYKQDKNPRVRRAAFWALRTTRDPRIFEIILEMLNDDDANMRAEAATQLGRRRDERAYAALMAGLRDRHSRVRNACARALIEMNPDAALYILDLDDKWIRMIALSKFERRDDSTAIEVLVSTLNDPEPELRCRAIRALCREKFPISDDKPLFRAIVAKLKDESGQVRKTVRRELSRMHKEDRLSYLAADLKDEDDDVRAAAAYALQTHQSKQALKLLVEAIRNEEDRGVRNALRRSLWRLTGNDLSPAEWQEWWAKNNQDLQEK